MSEFIYKTGIFLYDRAIAAAAPFNNKALLLQRGRKEVYSILEKAFQGNKQQVAWFHCASLGEFEQARPVIEGFKALFPAYKVLLTFFSPSGYEVRKNYTYADVVCYLPADTEQNAVRFVQLVNPSIAFFVKYEFWHYYLKSLKERAIPVISFSAIFRENQHFFKPWGGFYKRMLNNFDQIFVQNEESAQLLQQVGITQVSIAGDTRFDRVKFIVDNKKEIKKAAQFKNGHKLLAIGSSWPEDIKVLLPFINQFSSSLKILIAPHEVSANAIEQLRKQISKETVLYSEASDADLSSAQVLIIDNVGMLSSLYQYAEFAWIGGAFGKGLHNILEAATYGMPVFFGPNFRKFQEAKDLISQGAAFTVNDTSEFTQLFAELYDDTEKLKKVSEIAAAYVSSRTGATKKVLDYVVNLSLAPTKN